MYDCVCDTDVLNTLLRAFPEFTQYLGVSIPARARVSKELRSNRVIQKHILNKRISVHELSQADRDHVADMIGRAIGRELGNRYRRNKMRHEAVEYESAFIASRLKVPVYYYDRRAYANCKDLLKSVDQGALVKRIDDLIIEPPIPRQNRRSIASHVLKMGYKVEPRVLEKIDYPT